MWGRHEDHPDQALAFAEAEGCDVVLTEIELWTERLGGIRLAKAVTEINPRVSIIFVTVFRTKSTSRLSLSSYDITCSVYASSITDR